jgi:hypothetical protein
MTITIRPAGSGPKRMRAIIAGTFGVGKNWLAGTMAKHKEMGPVLVVNIEGGTETVANVDGVFETNQLQSVADVEEVFWNVANGSEGFKDFRSIVIDSGSALSQMCLVEVARANAKANKSEIRMSQQDYGDSGTIVLDLLRRFRNLDKHIIVTAGLREDFDVDKPTDKLKRGPARVGPDFPPALARKVMHVFDAVWILQSDDSETRQMLTQAQAPYVAKTRGKDFAQALGNVVTDPDLAEIFTLYLKTQGKAGKK